MMARINFTVLSNPAKLAVPAFATTEDFVLDDVRVARGIARRNRGYSTTNHCGAWVDGRPVFVTRISRKNRYSSPAATLLGEVTFVVAK